jgi:hypothetical protein
MEERWFQVGNVTVKEGDMTLTVAKIVAARLRSLGATVSFTRSRPGPTTSSRPRDFHSIAVAELRKEHQPITHEAVKKKSEELFYRVAEIRNRARLINERLRPDLTICLHFNAEEWSDERHAHLSLKNHLHLLVSGCLSQNELAKDDQRFDMLVKLLSRTYTEEIPVARVLSKSLARETDLPPFSYKGPNATSITPYVWARNLMANRLFQSPVVYVEAYVMNNAEVVRRVGAGDYKGYRHVAGVGVRKSIYREYADGIVDGLLQYYTPATKVCERDTAGDSMGPLTRYSEIQIK